MKYIFTHLKGKLFTACMDGDIMIEASFNPIPKLSNDGTVVKNSGLLGNIYVGKVKNIVKNINAAFVDIGDGQSCFLSLNKAKHPIYITNKKNDVLHIGDELLIQLDKEDIKSKRPVGTCNFSLPGRFVVLTYNKPMVAVSGKIKDVKVKQHLKELVTPFVTEEYGFILRTNAVEATDEELTEEINSMIEKYNNIKEYGVTRSCYSVVYSSLPEYLTLLRDIRIEEDTRIITDLTYLYEEIKAYSKEHNLQLESVLELYEDADYPLTALHGLETKLEKALAKKIWLKSGGSLYLQPTEALTVIDVNTEKAIAGKRKKEETFFKINKEAAIMAARQIRLRNYSGIIIIDFIDMEEEAHQKAVLSILRSEFMKDPVKTVLVDITKLGLVEVTRKKTRRPLHEQYYM
ncbi:MAG: ribonuclease E/G [Lachnospiraceae bacterium]|nr:ribonuclease E/G [Lachnospiraceae bacterium]